VEAEWAGSFSRRMDGSRQRRSVGVLFFKKDDCFGKKSNKEGDMKIGNSKMEGKESLKYIGNKRGIPMDDYSGREDVKKKKVDRLAKPAGSPQRPAGQNARGGTSGRVLMVPTKTFGEKIKEKNRIEWHHNFYGNRRGGGGESKGKPKL